MKRLLTLLLAAGLACAAGCAKPVMKTWQASGGSRADATVEVGYVYNPEQEIPQHADGQALAEAEKRCRAWGYSSAEPFGLTQSRCSQFRPLPFGGSACWQMLVTRQYQCLGRGDSQIGTDFVGPIQPRK